MLVQSMMGISAHAPSNTLTVDRPMLPDWLESLELHDVRIGRSRVSLSFRRGGPGVTGFSVLGQEGDVTGDDVGLTRTGACSGPDRGFLLTGAASLGLPAAARSASVVD